MDPGPEHEFTLEQEDVFIALSESLYRFGFMFSVLGLGVIALGITVAMTGAYGGGLAIAFAGFIAAIGGSFFLRPRSSFDRITRTHGRDITRLMEGLDSLNSAYGLLRLMLVAFVLARAAALVVSGLS